MDAVTLSLSNAGQSNVTGASTIGAAGGVATFSDLVIDRPAWLGVDPRDERVICAGTARSVVVRSTDGGETWSRLDRLADKHRADSAAS